MINIKKLHFFPIIMFFYSCMEPVDEGLWSIDQKELFDTQGFCRNVSLSGNKAFVAAGQAGVQVWDLNSGNKLHEYLGYSQDGSYIEFDDISIVQRDSVNDLIFVTESNRKVKIFYFGDSSEFIYRNEIMSDRTKDYISFPSSNNTFTMYVADNDDGLKWGTYRSDTTVVFNLEIINWMPTTGGELFTDGKPLGIDATRSFPLLNDNDIVAMAIDQLGVEFYNLVYDLSDENSGGEPSFLSKFDLGGNAEQVSITDDGAYIACDDFGAYFISLESIRTGEGVAVSFAEDLTVDHVSVKSNVAVLSLGSRGLALYDVSNPLGPKSKGIFDVGYVYKTYFWGDHILICTRSGLQVSKIK